MIASEVMNDMPGAVIYACAENTLHSSMVERMFKNFQDHRIYIVFVDLRAGKVDDFAVGVLYEISVDLSVHRLKYFDDLKDDYYDLVITLSSEPVELRRTIEVDLEFWHMFDPSFVEGNHDVRLNPYRHISHQLMELVRDRLSPTPTH